MPAKRFEELNDSVKEAKELFQEDPTLTNLSAVDISDPGLSCDYVINQLILHITEFKSIFYFLVNGWYLG